MIGAQLVAQDEQDVADRAHVEMETRKCAGL